MTVEEVHRIMAALEYQREHGSAHPNDAVFMLRLLDKKIIGMDGFKFCFLDDAKDARRRTIEAIRQQGLQTLSPTVDETLAS